MKTKVLLDTDIGSDIDDAVALAYLLAQPKCDLVGITTVTGQPEVRAAMCSAICQVVGRDVPIYPGAPGPLLFPQRQAEVPQAVALPKWKHRTDFPRGEAISFMRKVIRDNPGEVVLLTIGPLTNIGLLFTADPELPALLKSLVLMCGVFSNKLVNLPPTEWNALVQLPAEEVRRRFTAPLLGPVLDFAEAFFSGGSKMLTFHDPLAATTIFNESVCGFERGNVDIELAGTRFAGATSFKLDPAGQHEVALKVDPQGFFDEYFGVLNKASSS